MHFYLEELDALYASAHWMKAISSLPFRRLQAHFNSKDVLQPHVRAAAMTKHHRDGQHFGEESDLKTRLH